MTPEQMKKLKKQMNQTFDEIDARAKKQGIKSQEGITLVKGKYKAINDV